MTSDARGIRPAAYGLLTLPGGLGTGFITVTLGYVLTQQGFSVAQMAAIIAIHSLPSTWRFLMGPVVDVSLSPRRWYLICLIAGTGCIAAFAVAPLSPTAMPLLLLLSLGHGMAANASSASIIAAMALTSPHADRTTVGGWAQAGSLSGVGLGGGLGLWLATHAGGPAVSALVLSCICLACAFPLLWLRTPVRTAARFKDKVTGLVSGLWRFVASRTGVLAVIAVTIPAALNASGNLYASVAADWGAPADLVALVTGVLSGVLSLPGCVVAGYLCKRFPSRVVYVFAAALCALGQVGMALGPQTPAAFATFILVNAVVQGLAWGAVTAVIYEHLSPAAAATLGTMLGSLCNVPVVLMIVLVGRVQTASGSVAMLLTEAGVAVVSLTAYSLLAWLWKPGRLEQSSRPLAAA